jgi:LacI family transcriptional regulator
VLIDRVVRHLEADAVCIDNQTASRGCVRRLIEAGHRRIGVVAELERWEGGTVEDFLSAATAGNVDSSSLFPSWQRFYGYLEAVYAAGLPIDLDLIGRVGVYSVDGARKETQRLLEMQDRPTALFTADGLMSAAAMDAINSLDLQIPKDLSLICFDDLDWMSFIRPGISAVVQPLMEMGENAGRLLLSRIMGDEGEFQRLALQPRFALRGSIAAPPAS